MANLRIGRRSGLVFRGGRNRRETLWTFIPTSQINIAAADTAVLAFAGNTALLALRPFTVIRQRINWYCRSDVGTGGELWGAAFGSCVVSDQAVAIGVTAVPTPITDQGSDLWVMYEENYGRFIGTPTSEVGRQLKIDSRAMRKVEEGQDFIFVVETPGAAVSVSATSVFGGRLLVKLH